MVVTLGNKINEMQAHAHCKSTYMAYGHNMGEHTNMEKDCCQRLADRYGPTSKSLVRRVSFKQKVQHIYIMAVTSLKNVVGYH